MCLLYYYLSYLRMNIQITLDCTCEVLYTQRQQGDWEDKKPGTDWHKKKHCPRWALTSVRRGRERWIGGPTKQNKERVWWVWRKKVHETWDGYGKRHKMTTKKYERPKSGGRVSDCEGIGGITVDRICEISKQQRRYTVNRIDEIKKVRRRERE